MEGGSLALTGKENKYHIAPDSIRANIYDQVELLVDFHGITKKDIELAQEAMKEVLDPKEYSMSEELFSLDVADVDDEIDIGKSLEEMNQISFKVFIQHITNSFANDLVKGFSDKVKTGVNENE